METMLISCPECDKQIRLPADAAGKKIRCKACEHVFVVQAPAADGGGPARGVTADKPDKKGAGKAPDKKPAKKPEKPPAPAGGYGLAADDDGDSNPYQVTDLELGHRCPQCAAEMESEDAVVCLNCGYNTTTRVQLRARKIKEVTGQDKFMWLLPGILCVVAILLLIGYCFFHYFALPNILVDDFDSMEEAAGGRIAALKDERFDDKISFWQAALIHPAIALWIFIGIAFGCYYLGKFAVRRLIQNPDPPEVEV